MSYPPSMIEAARRNLKASNELKNIREYDVSGYLAGISAECALKALIEESGLRSRLHLFDKDPFFLHFPELKQRLTEIPHGRLFTLVLRVINKPQFMRNWNIKMRYSKNRTIDLSLVESWEKDAKELINLINTL